MPRKFFRRVMPDPQRIRNNRLLTWLGPWIHHPGLWHVSREGIARGTAIGGFFGFLLPVGQIPVAALAAVALRGNLPMTVAGTLITNPFTVAPIYYFAYKVGLWLMGAEPSVEISPDTFAGTAQSVGWLSTWSGRLMQYGKPLFVGLGTLGTAFAALSYFGINWVWRAVTLRAWRGRGWRSKKRTRTESDRLKP